MIRMLALFIVVLSSSGSFAEMHTYDGSDSLRDIEVQVVYYLPKDNTPIPDWKDRIQYHIDRAKKFHLREFAGQSNIDFHLAAKPFISSTTQDGMPKDNPNTFFWFILNEVSEADAATFSENKFPILLVVSDHNFSNSYDDWTRVCSGQGCLFDAPHEQCKGHVRGDGDHRPGTRCGGSRAVYWAAKHHGYGLISADGWLVPMKGTDCVFYHEGIGHPIGLPHPEPNDDSVMGTAQYADAIHKTWVNAKQKQKLGWKEIDVENRDLFSNFDVYHLPIAPKENQPITFAATIPNHFDVERITLEYQTELYSQFKTIQQYRRMKTDDVQTFQWDHPGLQAGKSLSYRIQVHLTDGTSEQLWHYLKIN